MHDLLGIDVGTSAVKVGVFDLQGRLKHFRQIACPAEHPQPGWAEIPPEKWWQAVVRIIGGLIEEDGLDPGGVNSVGISTLCPALIAVDERMSPLRPAIIYYDQRSQAEIEAIRQIVPEQTFLDISGNRLMPGTCSLSSMMYIKTREPGLYQKTRYFGHANSYLACRLTGRFFMDRTNASFTGLYPVTDGREWSWDIAGALGFKQDCLPPVLLSSELAGTVSRQASRSTGLLEGTPVVIGGADTACSALALGVIEEGNWFESCGTSDVITLCRDRPVLSRTFLNRCHVIDRRWLWHGAMSTPGATIEWLQNEVYLWEKKEAEKGGESCLDRITRAAADSPPGANHLVFLPYMSGERTPIWDSNARGVLFGLSLNTKRPDIFRALLEGVAYGLRQIAEIARKESELELRQLLCAGGASRSTLWSQIKADVLQVPLITSEYQDTAVLGAALLGGLATGAGEDLPDLVRKIDLGRRTTYFPDSSQRNIYDRMYAVYVSLYPLLKEQFREITGLVCG